jgi:Fe2+ transport system protein B
MRKFLTALKDGMIKGLKTVLMLLKILIPIYLLVVLIKYSPVMPWLQDVAAPVMKIFRLPPEAAVPVVTGLFSDEYGVVAALGGFDFSMAAITTIAMIALAAHSLPVEAAVAQKIGLPAGVMVLLRVGTAIFTGILVGWLGGVFL